MHQPEKDLRVLNGGSKDLVRLPACRGKVQRLPCLEVKGSQTIGFEAYRKIPVRES